MILDKITNISQDRGLSKNIDEAFNYIGNTDFSILKNGRYDIDSNMFVLVNEYSTKENESNISEAHRKYIDLQYVLSGSEIIEFETLENQNIVKEYDKENDYSLYNLKNKSTLILSEGMFALFYPEDLHMPGLINNESVKIKKIVIKILIDK